MITFSDLLTYTLVLIEVITLVVILSDKKQKNNCPSLDSLGSYFLTL